MEYAYIDRNYYFEDGERYLESCRWVGKNRLATVNIREAMDIENGEIVFKTDFAIGSMRLRVVDNEHRGGLLIVTRDIWLAPIYKIALKLSKSLQVTYHCFIYILNIWGLADYHPAQIPSWRDIRILKRFIK